jgi:hypothetical protein
MSEWSLSMLLAGLHENIERQLSLARSTIGHSVAKGDASEAVWLELLQTYLPKRYQAAKAFVVDSGGGASEQIDVLIFDRQYSPFIFEIKGQTVIPAESVYAVFEAKQSINAEEVRYAKKKVASVRRLHRTSLPIPHAGGTYPAKTPGHILGGLLTFESDWKPGMSDSLVEALKDEAHADGRLDLGCVAAHGIFGCGSDHCYTLTPEGKPATAFLFELIARLQSTATVPMIDIRAYAKWLTPT